MPGAPESFADLAIANSSQVSRDTAPGTQLKPGAARAAIRARSAMATVGGQWQPLGKTPLVANRAEYDQSDGSTKLGLVNLSGRVNGFARSASGALYAGVANGGVWQSDDDAATWRPIGESLPTQVVSSVAWSPADGGTVLALTGDHAFGGSSFAGLGVYRSQDGGATWQHAEGVPDGVLSFKIEVDPNQPGIVYAATGAGLFRSTDAGRTFTNVALPTGAEAPDGTPNCSGKPPTQKDCFLANMVTDVVVQGPANANTSGGKPGAVMAAVGWRAGNKPNADGSQQSPGNGIYVSDTGAPGTFKSMHMADNAIPNPPPGSDLLTQARIGRTELGIATGPDQDHRIVYAMVEDAAKFNGGATGIDANEPGVTKAAQSDVFNALWVSTDFGASWRELEGSSGLDDDPASGSALAPPVCKTPGVVGYCPGVQAWYNLWVQPDPTRATASGVPTRLGFGLEEVWANDPATTPPSGFDGSSPHRFKVIGRYFANKACTILNATNGLPICPATAGPTPDTTTHPDQHMAIWIPDGSGGVTLLAGNDGGVYRQHAAAGEELTNDKWGNGHNAGLHTLMPYDAAMAKDGTVYMGLQDNGEAKIDPDGTTYTVFGGDGFFTAVDPDHPDVAYEEYVGGVMSSTTDGGKHWASIDPGLTSSLFSTPFEMDTNDAKHLLVGGRDIREEITGPSGNWVKVYDLGSQKKPGDANAGGDPSSDDGPDNQLSAVHVMSIPALKNAPLGPKTKDFSYEASGAEFPGGQPITEDPDVFQPGTYEDHDFTIGKDDGDAAFHVKVTWKDAKNDWDLYVYRVDKEGNETRVGKSTESQGKAPGIQGGAPAEESVTVNDPLPGDYRIRLVNFSASGPADRPHVDVTFDQRTDPKQLSSGYQSDSAYVAYCGFCDTITQGTPFANGIATNVGGAKPGAALKPDGWHIAKAKNLPSRYITSIRVDPQTPTTVYVTLAGYGRRWAFPGAVGEDISKVGTGHVYKSIDAGKTFFDISGDLPDTPANWSVVHGDHVIVGTDIGVFESCDTSGRAYSRLGTGLPTTPISTLRLKPGDPDTLVAATYGRGVYTYHFDSDNVTCPPPPARAVLAAEQSGIKACTAQRAFIAVGVKPRGRGLRLSAPRRNPPIRYSAFVFRQAAGGRVLPPRPVARFSGMRSTITWNGKPNVRGRKVTDGYYFARFGLKLGALGDVRRVALSRRGGRWHVRRAFDYHSACRVLQLAKLSGPTFGGTKLRPMGISFRLALPAGSANVVVKRGKRTIKRVTYKSAGTTLHRLKLPAKPLRKGDYRVTITAKIGKRKQVLTLLTRRI